MRWSDYRKGQIVGRFRWAYNLGGIEGRLHPICESMASALTKPLRSFGVGWLLSYEVRSDREYREIIIGHSTRDRLLLVCFTGEADNLIRIISARLATRMEREDYEENRGL